MKLVLIRHGESVWNKENVYTGWTDVDLSEKGMLEAKEAGIMLKEAGFTFDLAYTSLLKRAINTLDIVLGELGLNIEVKKTYKLNERHYGALQGLNKDETRAKYGDEQVKKWRRSLNEMPPLLDESDKRHPINDPLYKGINYHPSGENLVMTMDRVLDCYLNEILVPMKEGKEIIISAHGNSLRALVAYLDNLNEEEILELNIPTGSPLVYEFDSEFKPIKHYYLKDQ